MKKGRGGLSRETKIGKSSLFLRYVLRNISFGYLEMFPICNYCYACIYVHANAFYRICSCEEFCIMLGTYLDRSSPTGYIHSHRFSPLLNMSAGVATVFVWQQYYLVVVVVVVAEVLMMVAPGCGSMYVV